MVATAALHHISWNIYRYYLKENYWQPYFGTYLLYLFCVVPALLSLWCYLIS